MYRVVPIPTTLEALDAILRRYTKEAPSAELPAVLGELEAMSGGYGIEP